MNALATSTENTLPKFELAVILMYLSMLAKVRRPSSTPSSSTIRLFSSRMMSAASLAMSTALSTEMPMSAVRSAGASLMPSPMKPTTWPLPLSSRTMRSLCDGVSLAKTLVRLHRLRQFGVAHALDVVAQQQALLLQADFAADLRRHQFVVAGQHLHRHAMRGQGLEGRRGAFLRRIEECHVTDQRQFAARRPRCRSSRPSAIGRAATATTRRPSALSVAVT